MNDDDTLILYYYGDGLSETERADVEVALASDPALGERYAKLCRELDELRDQPAVPAPAHAVERWHLGIEKAAAAEHGKRRSNGRGGAFPGVAWAALAATLVAGIFIGLYVGDAGPPAPAIADRDAGVAVDVGPGVVPVAFSRGVEQHLRQSRREIVSLDGGADRTLLIMDILRQNRLFERAAQQNDAEDVARVLRAFEPVLLRLADENLTAEDAAALRAKLAFELDVVLTKMGQRESDDTDSI